MKKPTLREWLNQTGTTTTEIANKSGISRQTISYYLNGRVSLTWESAMAIWEATDYDVRLSSLSAELSEKLDETCKKRLKK